MAATTTDLFVPTQIPHQKTLDDIPFPAVITPNPNSSSKLDLPLFLSAVAHQKPYLESLLHHSGAILLRGFPVLSAADFDCSVASFGYDEHPYFGGASPRTRVVGRVFTANESPPDKPIPFHHELSQVPNFPSKLFFFCEVEPRSGGETPLALSHRVYERTRELHPEFVRKLEEVGLIYTRVLGDGDDPSSAIGRGWQSAFLTTDRSLAQQRKEMPFIELNVRKGSMLVFKIMFTSNQLVFVPDMSKIKLKGEEELSIPSGLRAAELGTKMEWLEDGVKTVMGPIPAVKFDETRKRKIWFNNMVAAYTGWKDERNDPVKAVTFGDGTPLPVDIIDDCSKILDEESIAIPWKQGDIILLDNLAVLHSRRSFEPPRRILASLCM